MKPTKLTIILIVGFLFTTIIPTVSAGYDLNIANTYIEERTNMDITKCDMLSATNVTIGDTITISFTISNIGNTVSNSTNVEISLYSEGGEYLIDKKGKTYWQASLYYETDIIIAVNSSKDFVYVWDTDEWIHTPAIYTVDFLPNPGRYFVVSSFYPTNYLEDETDNNSGSAFSDYITLNENPNKEKSKENSSLSTACCIGTTLIVVIVIIIIILVHQKKQKGKTPSEKKLDMKDTTNIKIGPPFNNNQKDMKIPVKSVVEQLPGKPPLKGLGPKWNQSFRKKFHSCPLCKNNNSILLRMFAMRPKLVCSNCEAQWTALFGFINHELKSVKLVNQGTTAIGNPFFKKDMTPEQWNAISSPQINQKPYEKPMTPSKPSPTQEETRLCLGCGQHISLKYLVCPYCQTRVGSGLQENPQEY